MADFVGYHGTSSQNASLIMQRNFRVDHRKVGWLGSGVYFFEENYEMANYWANTFSSDIAVIRCEINVPETEILDVTDPGSNQSKLFHATRKELIEKEIRRHRVDIFVRNSEDLDGKVFNLLCIAKRYKLVRSLSYTYQDHDREYRLRASRVPNGIELCLRDTWHIKSKSVV